MRGPALSWPVSRLANLTRWNILFRDDNDYAVAWIRQHGKGRVFYTALGHNPDLFWDPRMLEMFLAGTQYALGHLDAAAPEPRATRR